MPAQCLQALRTPYLRRGRKARGVSAYISFSSRSFWSIPHGSAQQRYGRKQRKYDKSMGLTGAGASFCYVKAIARIGNERENNPWGFLLSRKSTGCAVWAMKWDVLNPQWDALCRIFLSFHPPFGRFFLPLPLFFSDTPSPAAAMAPTEPGFAEKTACSLQKRAVKPARLKTRAQPRT